MITVDYSSSCVGSGNTADVLETNQDNNMLRKYKKQDAPRWQRRLVIILSGLFAATVLLFAAWAVILFLDSA